MHVERLEQHHNTNILPTMWAQKIDDSKKISILKKGVGIKGEKIMETS